ncbi:sensor histidine kinase [Spirosoma pulveris]
MFSSPDVKLLTSVLDNYPEPIVLHTPVFGSEASDTIVDFILLYFNDAARQQANLPYALMKGQKVSELTGYSQEGRKQLTQQLIQVYTTGNDLQTTYYNELLDIHFEVLRRKIDGAIFSITRNVNAEIKERLQKQQQQAFVNLILNNSLNGWFVLEAVLDENQEVIDFLFTRVNTIFLQLSGLSQEQVIGKRFLILFPATKDNGSFERNKQVYQTGIAQRSQSHYTAGRSDAWYDSVVAKMGERSLLVTFADVTELNTKARELENKNYILDNIFTHSMNGISFGQVIRNQEGRIIDGKPIMANKAAIQLVGIPEELYFAKTSVELEPNILNTPYFQKIIHTMDTGEPSLVEYQLESTGRWIEISLSRMDRDHLIIIFTDVTDIKAIELQKEQLIDELKRTNAALENFTRAASHDLQEPLRKIMAFGNMLIQDYGPVLGPGLPILQRMQSATQRMQVLITGLLNLSRYSQARDIRREPIDLSVLVGQVLSDLDLTVKEKQAVVVEPLPTLQGDALLLQQVFQNLLTNALKFVKPGQPPRIQITSEQKKGDDLPLELHLPRLSTQFYWQITVSDQGIGFESAYRERIFDAFERLHGRSSPYAGTGIGLAIVRQVMDNHHGAVTAHSQPGEGAQFTLYFPVVA